jgi:hypothetical protein
MLFAPPFGLLASGLAGSKDLPAHAGSNIIAVNFLFVNRKSGKNETFLQQIGVSCVDYNHPIRRGGS